MNLLRAYELETNNVGIYDNGLKMVYTKAYTEWLQEKYSTKIVKKSDVLDNVSQQRELLIDFYIKLHQSTREFNELVEPDNIVDEYLKGNL